MNQWIKTLPVSLIVLVALAWGWTGCGEEGMEAPNVEPETRITGSRPSNGGSVSNHVEVLFTGGDFDGRIDFYEFLIEEYPPAVDSFDDIAVVQPSENDPRWTRVNAARVELVLKADLLRADPRGDIGDGEFERWHTFHVRSVDDTGARDRSPAHVTFRAFTLAPNVWLNQPAIATQSLTMPTTFVMNWDGSDPIDEFNFQRVSEARWAFEQVTLDGGGNPLGYPEAIYDLPASAWSDWVAWTSADSLGREAVLRDLLVPGALDQAYVFVLQGRDDAGAETPKFFDDGFRMNNLSVITVTRSIPNGPQLTLSVVGGSLQETHEFTGIGAAPVFINTAEDSVKILWQRMRAAHYGANGGEYRIGWNLQSPGEDDEWTEWEPFLFAAPQKHLALASEEFRLQARDHLGQVTTAILSFIKP